MSKKLTDETRDAIADILGEIAVRGFCGPGAMDAAIDAIGCIILDAEDAAKGGVNDAIQIIKDCQKILADHLPPHGSDEKTTISKLLEILDGPRARAVVVQDQ